MLNIFYVGIGGAIGAVLRACISEAIPLSAPFPSATFGTNLLGSFLLGLFLTNTTLIQNTHIKLALTTGMLGAFTTFSTFSYETLWLVQNGFLLSAVIYVLGSLCGGILCSACGIFIARRWAR